jgi:RHS repeat-associated protein
MKFIMNNIKRFAVGVIVIWIAMGNCFSQSGQNNGPIAADQQTEAKDLAGKRGDQKVDLFTGSFAYSIPIACALARNGSEPDLALVYSSGGDNGWCGMGWKLDIGFIERNTKDGFPIKFSTAAPAAPLNQYDDSKGFILNLFGKEYKLLQTATANEYRPEVDTDFLRCVLDTSNNKWTIYDKSGNVYYFGSTTDGSSKVINPKSGWPPAGQPAYSATFHWALDKIDTATGDETTIAYTTYNDPNNPSIPEKTIYPTQITYNSHTNINGYGASYTGTHTISFGTEVRTDWRFSYHWGFRTEQTRLLTNIVCQVGSQKIWRYALSYTTSTPTGRSLLHTVTTYGSDDTTSLPVQTFTYQGNPNVVSFGSTIEWTGLNLNSPDSSSIYQPWVTHVNSEGVTIADLIDIDGDGLPDRVSWDSLSTTSPNKYQVQKNLGLQANGTSGSFGTRYAFGPTSTGNGALANPSTANPVPDNEYWSALNAGHVRLRDINGDGLPDRVADWWEHFDSSYLAPYTNFQVMLNNGSGFAADATWPVSPVPLSTDGSADSSGFWCAVEGGAYVGFFDINGDGLPDRVMAKSGTLADGPMTNFIVQFNTGTSFTASKLFGPYHSQNWNNPSDQGGVAEWAAIETPEAHMIDINGDGLPDRLMFPMSSTDSELHPTTYYAVEYNDGYSFEAINTSTTVPGAADQWPGGTALETANGGSPADAIENLPYVGLFDVNGDGLPDRVMLDSTSIGTSSSRWLVYLNNGHGFNTTPITVSNIENQGQWGSGVSPVWWSMEGSYYSSGILTALMDVNGDGLLDRVMAVYDSSGLNTTHPYFLVQLNDGPFPDLLTGINNGMGGTIAVSYKPSTVWDNREYPTVANSGSTLPFPQQTVATVTESDGVNPARITSYSYAGGFYDGSRREFAGFAVVTNIDPTLRTTITYFHTGGGRNYASSGEYQDTGNFAKRGMPYRIETYGNDSPTPLLYHVTVNQVDQKDLSYSTFFRYFPFISQTFEYDYPGAGTPRITGSKFVYSPYATDALTYNLTEKILWGEVSAPNLSTFATLSDLVPADTQYYWISYATSSSTGNSNIKDHPDTVSLTSDAAGSTILKETKYIYSYSQNSSYTGGTIWQEETRICPGPPAEYAVKTTSYNSYGLPTSITDPVGVQTTIAYDSTYNIYPATTTIGSLTTTTTYDVRSGLLTQSIDPMGVTVNNTYNDPFFRLTESDKIPVGGTAIWMKKESYNLGAISSGNAVSYDDVQVNDGVSTLDNNSETGESRTYFDGFGRPIETITQGENSNYRSVSTAYDGRGNPFLTTWPQFVTSITPFSKPSGTLAASCIAYDPAGRVSQTYRRVQATFNNSGNGEFDSQSYSGVATGDTGTSPLAPKQWSYVNGTDPWWIVCTDEDNKVRRYGLDAFGRTNQIQEIDGSSTYTTTLSYDLADNLTQIHNQNSEIIYYAYDNAGNMVAMADPYLGQWTYQRDADGRLRIQTDARGDVVTYSYVNPSTSLQDPLGRVQMKQVFSSVANYSANNPYSTATYIYDVNNTDNGTYPLYKGLLYMVTDSEGWEKNGYDTRGRLTITTRHLNVNNQNYTTTYTYNDGDEVASIGYPNSGPTINYTYFHGGSINLVSRNGSTYNYYTAAASSFDVFGHVTSFTYGNNVATTRSYYSNSKRLQTIAAGSVFNRTYQYTAGDDIANISGTDLSSTAITYDNLHRIKTYTGLPSSGYVYDPIGTITTSIESGTAATYGYGNARKQAVKSAYGYTYLYDLCGNMIVRHGGTTGSQALQYDPENQLTVFSQPGTVTAEFGYAADGARLWKRLNQDPTKVQVWIGKIYEEKNDANGNHTLFHVFAGDQQVCTFEAGSALAVTGGDSTKVGYYYHEDSLNSSSALSDSSGNQKEVDVYYPFGRTVTGTLQASFQVSRKFTGQVYDQETGLYYYNARYYDPELGRFIQADTVIQDLSNPQSYNRYSYCVNDPLRYNDPSGHGFVDYLPFRSTYLEIHGHNQLDAMVVAHTDYGSYKQFMDARPNAVPTAGDMGAVAAVAHGTVTAADIYINGSQEIATAGIATGVIGLRRGGQALAHDAEEETEAAQIHHIGTDKNSISEAAGGPYTPKFEALYEKAGMTLQDVLNKVPVLGHKGPHPEYNQIVFDRLAGAVKGLNGDAYKSALQNELKVIGKESQTAGTHLNTLITKKTKE